MPNINSIVKVAPGKEYLFEGKVRYLGADGKGNVALIRLDIDKPHMRLRRIRSPFVFSQDSFIEGLKEKLFLPNQAFETGLSSIIKKMNEDTLKKMEDNFGLMEPLLFEDEILFNPLHRGIKFKEHAAECGVNLRTLNRLYNRYFWGGQNKYFLAPAVHRLGGPGKLQRKGTKRRGRLCKSRENPYEKVKPKSQVCGYKVSDKLQEGYRRYILKGNFTVAEAFEKTLIDYFSVGEIITGYEHGKPIYEAEYLSDDKLPSLFQFEYWEKN